MCTVQKCIRTVCIEHIYSRAVLANVRPMRKVSVVHSHLNSFSKQFNKHNRSAKLNVAASINSNKTNVCKYPSPFDTCMDKCNTRVSPCQLCGPSVG